MGDIVKFQIGPVRNRVKLTCFFILWLVANKIYKLQGMGFKPADIAGSYPGSSYNSIKTLLRRWHKWGYVNTNGTYYHLTPHGLKYLDGHFAESDFDSESIIKNIKNYLQLRREKYAKRQAERQARLSQKVNNQETSQS